jgi:hypothetical protein
MPTRTKRARSDAVAQEPMAFAAGDKVSVAGAGREWLGKITTRRLQDGRDSIHPQYDDTAIFVTFDETGISMPVALTQVSRVRR